jgi:hypothetical protein
MGLLCIVIAVVSVIGAILSVPFLATATVATFLALAVAVAFGRRYRATD